MMRCRSWSRWCARRARNAFSAEVLTNPSGFGGVDGVFRFRSDGMNERGLAVMKVATGGGTGGGRRPGAERALAGT